MTDGPEPRESSGGPARVQLEGITKHFGNTAANDGVTLEVRPGEVHALLGENGAGKTTLMKILYGLYRPDEGRILIDGAQVAIRSPQDALRLGIGMIHQHFMLVPTMTVAENYAIGRVGGWRGWSARAMARTVLADSAAAGLPIDPAARVADLSVGAQQRVEIVRALGRGARVLILDEPTAVLTPSETRELMAALRRLVTSGASVVFISHKLQEVMEISGRVSVLRAGRLVATVRTADTSERALAQLMIGRALPTPAPRPQTANGAVALSVRGLTVRDGRGHDAVNGLSFDLRGGEILGVAGVDGNGQAELSQGLAGLRPASSGAVQMGSIDLTRLSPAERIMAGFGFVTEDRQIWGLFPALSIAENLIAERHAWPAFSRHGFLRRRASAGAAEALVRDYDIRPPLPGLPVGVLSGGNKQKVVIARTLARRPAVIVISQPTRGVDLGASDYIRQRIAAERARGAAILLISADLDEVLALSDRVAVMYEGRFTAILSPAEATTERVGLLMAGITSGAGAQPAVLPAEGLARLAEQHAP